MLEPGPVTRTIFSSKSPLTPTRVEAEATGAKRHDLQQSAGHRNVLEEVKELVLVAEVAVEDQGRRHAEDGESSRRNARAKTER
jgi:hypothetical protein